MRTKVLPTIKSKESALRVEVKRSKDKATDYLDQLNLLTTQYDYMTALWAEFDVNLLKIKDIEVTVIKIAGVRIPLLKELIFGQKRYDLFSAPIWFADGISLLKSIAQLRIEFEVFNYKAELLESARKKTTQKVNLYEKVQIPGYEDAIRKIKRFLEDEENLSKSAQKIVKTRHQAEEE